MAQRLVNLLSLSDARTLLAECFAQQVSLDHIKAAIATGSRLHPVVVNDLEADELTAAVREHLAEKLLGSKAQGVYLFDDANPAAIYTVCIRGKTPLKSPYAIVVAKGIAFLDVKRPGWQSFIDVDRLSLASPSQCILGQIYGRYSLGVSTLGIDGNRGTNRPDNPELYGFISSIGTGSATHDDHELTEEWRRQLAS